MQSSKDVALKYIMPAKQARAKTQQIPKIVLKISPQLTPLPQAKKLTKPLRLAMIGAASFQYFTKQINAEIFAILMRNIKYQLNKTEKFITDSTTVVLKCYHNFLDIFSKKTSDRVLLYLKHNQKIKLLEKRKIYGQAAFCNMSKPQLKLINKFLEKYLKKSFIKASKALCLLLILLVKKFRSGVRFCVDYKKLNTLIKKDAYPILLIAKTLAQVKKVKIFTKINI